MPTRLVFGLEEIFTNTLPRAADGPGLFTSIGNYNANGGACLLVLASDLCSDIQQATPDKLTTHPDQHGAIFIPDGEGGVTLFAGNDGGNYRQHTDSSGDFSPPAAARATKPASTRCCPTESRPPGTGSSTPASRTTARCGSSRTAIRS